MAICPACGEDIGTKNLRKHCAGKLNADTADVKHLRILVENLPGAFAYLKQELEEVEHGRESSGSDVGEPSKLEAEDGASREEHRRVEELVAKLRGESS